MKNNIPETNNNLVNIGHELSKKITVYTNLDHDIVVTTSDKIKLVLIETKDVLISLKSWMTPFSVLLTLIVTLLTTDFKQEKFGINAAVWKSTFILSSLICLFWLIYSIIKAEKNKNKGDVEEIIQRLKLKNIEKTTDTINNPLALNIEILHIKYAGYGTESGSIDVTELLNNSIKNNSLKILASNELAGDPDIGRTKQLMVHYVYQGKENQIIVDENCELSIPNK